MSKASDIKKWDKVIESVDHFISLEEKKLDLLKQLKKGYVQKRAEAMKS